MGGKGRLPQAKGSTEIKEKGSMRLSSFPVNARVCV